MGTTTAATKNKIQAKPWRLNDRAAPTNRLSSRANRVASDIGQPPLRREESRRPPLNENHHSHQNENACPACLNVLPQQFGHDHVSTEADNGGRCSNCVESQQPTQVARPPEFDREGEGEWHQESQPSPSLAPLSKRADCEVDPADSHDDQAD